MCRCYGNSSCFSDFRVVCLIIRALVSHSLSLLLSFPLSLTLSLSFTFQLYSLHSHRPFLIFQLPPVFPYPWLSSHPLQPCLPFPHATLCCALTAVTLLSSYLSSFVLFRLVSSVIPAGIRLWLIDNITKPTLFTFAHRYLVINSIQLTFVGLLDNWGYVGCFRKLGSTWLMNI